MYKILLIVLFFTAGITLRAQVPSIAWGNAIGGTGDDAVQAICVDPSGNVFIVGSFRGTVDFDPGSGVTNATATGTLGGGDAFVAKYSSSGIFLWVNTWGSADEDEVRGVVADGSFVYVTGYFTGTNVDFDDTSGSTLRTSLGNTDIFLAKFATASGAVSLVHTFGSSLSDYGSGVALDPSGNIYMAGNFQGSIDFDPSSGTATRATQGNVDMILAKYSNGGTYNWASALGSSTADYANAVHVNGSNVWVGGSYSGLFHADPNDFSVTVGVIGDFDGYFGHYLTTTGALIWGGTIRSSLTDEVTGIWADGTNLFTTGYFGGTATIYGDAGNLTLTSTGLKDGFVARHTISNHQLAWANKIGGSGDDYLNWITGDAANVYVVGSFADDIDMDPSTGVKTLVNAGDLDFMYGKYAVSNGALMGAFGAGEADEEQGTCIAVDASANLYISGMFSEDIDLDGTSLVASEASFGPRDVFFAKYGPGPAEPTLQPTGLVFTEVESTSYHYAFNASLGANVAGYVGIKKAGSAPTFVPVDGVPLVSGATNADGSIVDFVDSDLAWVVSTAQPNTTYHYAIYAYNVSGSNYNYRQLLPLTGTVTTAAPLDDAPPVIVTNTTPTTIAPGASLKVTVSITDNIAVDNAYVEFYPINTGESGYGYGDLVHGTGTTWEFTIPAQYNTEQGVEYNVYAYDAAGNSASTDWKQVVVAYPDEGLVFVSNFSGSEKTDYRIISVPLDIAKKTVNDVFADDIGSLDKSKYRLFKYGSNAVSELIATSPIELGRGYWFIATDAKSVDSGPGTTANAGSGKALTIPISSGWNLIGNPLNSNVPWSNISGDADNSDVEMGSLRVYKGRFQDGPTLEKYSGGFIMVQDDGDGVLHIPVIINDRKAAPTPENFVRSLDSDTWAVAFSLKSGEMVNSFGGFGMHPKAKEQNDRYDDFTLPRFMDYLELNYNKTLFGSAFTKDIVPTASQYTWEFQVESNLSEEVVELNWDNSFFGNSDRQLVLWDISQQRAVDMRRESRYSFQRGESGSFKIFFGDESFVKAETLPFHPVFHSASPVPSSGNVTLSFSVPETRGHVNTNISIYNLMGQKVANLVDQPLPGGYQQALWNIEDGTKPAAGMYISVLKFGDTTLQKRLIIR